MRHRSPVRSRPPGRTSPRTAMLCVEQTTNFAGGAVWSIGQLRGVRDVAQGAGLACHMDGARLAERQRCYRHGAVGLCTGMG
ncbi:beta-eliminating lyase-related protein [Cupriavidus basilensis]